MVIREGEKERMLVVSEAQELMRPTKPCAQSAYGSLAEKIHFPNAASQRPSGLTGSTSKDANPEGSLH